MRSIIFFRKKKWLSRVSVPLTPREEALYDPQCCFLTGFDLLYWVSFVSIAIALFRTFSRNPVRRRAENAKFLKIAGPALQWFRLRRTIHRDKEHCYFKCPNCGQQLRVPRGKGKITVTCRSCGAVFEEKS